MTTLTRAVAGFAVVVGLLTALAAGAAALVLSVEGAYDGTADVEELRLLLLGVAAIGLALLVVGRKALR